MFVKNTLVFLAGFVTIASGHVSMSYPVPRGSPGHPETGQPDYNLSSPLRAAVMCNGKPPGQVIATYNGIHFLVVILSIIQPVIQFLLDFQDLHDMVAENASLHYPMILDHHSSHFLM